MTRVLVAPLTRKIPSNTGEKQQHKCTAQTTPKEPTEPERKTCSYTNQTDPKVVHIEYGLLKKAEVSYMILKIYNTD